MEATIRTNDSNAFYSLVQFLKTLHFEVETNEGKTGRHKLEQKSTANRKKIQADGVSLRSEKSLAEEWNSKEDNRWDEIL